MSSSLPLATHRQELAAHASLRPAPASTPLPSYFPLPPLTDFDVPLLDPLSRGCSCLPHRLRRPSLDDRYIFVTADRPRSRSAGLALRPCGLSTSAGIFRAAQSASQWKSRNARRPALRYISLAWMPPNRGAGAGWPLTACVCQPMRTQGLEAESCGPTRQVHATLACP